MELLLVSFVLGIDQQTRYPQKLSLRSLVNGYSDFPRGLHAFAIRAVSSGIAPIVCGCNDIGVLSFRLFFLDLFL